ncbi:MAG: ATP-binding protein [Methylacidiphilales bacterium]|nr:ATP-binding protein [Candidatus Methylacidiphilales bacterium]
MRLRRQVFGMLDNNLAGGILNYGQIMQTWPIEQTPFLIFAAICAAALAVQYAWLRNVKYARLPWLVWVLAILLLCLGWNMSEQAGQRELNRIQSLTLDFAQLYADEMEKRGHWKLSSTAAANDPLYLNLIQTEINWEKLNPDVSDIYTLRKLPNGKNVFIVDSETDYNHNGVYDGEREERTPIGEVYDKADEGLERAFRGEANFALVPITDRWGTWVSAYVPLHDPWGRVEGALGVDFDAHEFMSAILNAKLRVISLVALLQLVLLGASTLNSVLRAQIVERKRNEAQLLQSQKLETVGKLAGGVAHEFNSILTAIICRSELLHGDLPAGSPLSESTAEIKKAAARAATLTRQLLAYGRRQFLQPEALDLNAVLAGMENTLRHLMGEGTDLRIVPTAGLKAVNADLGQIEEVIINLAMNAADAMPNGGKLTLETANITFGEESMGRDAELKPGGYVMLAITDTGTGMSEELRSRVFEPFFTTKDIGQGTGLGLSSCYGIIKQSGGHISVYSEPGRGTTFKIYLPQVEPQTKTPIQSPAPPDLPGGTEAVLVVEDDSALREMAAVLLARLGYTVFTAADGNEALKLMQRRDIKRIDLLFTDVVMPHMTGQELSERVVALYPGVKILFTSAYTENAIVHQGVLDKGAVLLQKPFTPSDLARKLREVLDQPGAPS